MEATIQQSSPHRVAGLGFTSEQLAARRKTLGASEIAAVAGLNPFKSPIAVYAEKLGLVPEFEGNPYTEWGLRLESAIRQKYADVTGAQLAQSPTILDRDHPWRSCTPDSLLMGENILVPECGLEIKRFGDYREDEFGPSGTDQVPVDVAAQCFWSMDIMSVRRWDVAVLIGQVDFRIFHLRYDADVAQALFDIGHEFWHKYVIPQVQPPIDGSSSASEYLAQRYKTHTLQLKEPTIEQVTLARELRDVKNRIDALEEEEAGMINRLKDAIGEAAGLTGVATWKAPRVGAMSWTKVKDAIIAGGFIGIHDLERIVAECTGEPARRFLLTIKEG